jgi:predicted O-methyltransferase YrrM
MSIVRNRKSIDFKANEYDLNGIPTRYFNKGELQVLITLIESVAAKSVIEFGVNNGRTPLAVLRNVVTVEKYIGVDVEQGYQTQMQCQRREVPIIAGELVLNNPKFELIVKPRGSFDLTPKDLPQVDVAFIDADHSRLGVENDYNIAKQIIRSGGLIIFHDDNCLPVVEVTQTLNDLCDLGHDIIHIKDTWLSYEVV